MILRSLRSCIGREPRHPDRWRDADRDLPLGPGPRRTPLPARVGELARFFGWVGTA